MVHAGLRGHNGPEAARLRLGREVATRFLALHSGIPYQVPE